MSMNVQRGVRPIRHDATAYNQTYTVKPTHEMHTVDYTYLATLGSDDTNLIRTPHGATVPSGNRACGATNDFADTDGAPDYFIYTGTVYGMYGNYKLPPDEIKITARDANGYISRLESQNDLIGNVTLSVPSRALSMASAPYLDRTSLPSSPQMTFVDTMNYADWLPEPDWNSYTYRTSNAQYFYIDFLCEYQLPDSSWGTHIVSQRQDCRYTACGISPDFSDLPKKYILTQTETEV